MQVNRNLKGLALVAALSGILTIGAVSVGAVGVNEAPRAAAARDEGLEGQMEILGKSMRTLKKNVGDAKLNEETLALVQKMQTAATAAKGMTPPVEADMAAEKKAAYVLGYKKQMVKLCATLLEVEAKLLDGKNDEAAKDVDALDKIMKDGHKVYKK